MAFTRPTRICGVLHVLASLSWPWGHVRSEADRPPTTLHVFHSGASHE